MDNSKNHSKVLILSPSAPNRVALSLLLKTVDIHDSEQPVLRSVQEIRPVLLSQFKKNLLPDPAQQKNLILINLKSQKEYGTVLENLPKEILGKVTKWRLEGLDFSSTEITEYMDTLVIVHFVLGADFVYKIENNEKVSLSFGDMNTSELLGCSNLFGELGISLSIYYEKSDEPTPGDLKAYFEAVKVGKEVAVGKFSSGEIQKEEIPQIIDQVTRSTSMQKRVDGLKERFCRDVEFFFGEREKRQDIGKKRVEIVESAERFKQYLAYKEEAARKKDEKKYEEMEKVLQKAIELLEGESESGQKSLLETYIDLSKSQVRQKKYLSAQKNASKAIKIEREAPSPKRLMGECQFGQAVESLKKGDYEAAGSFFERAESFIKESQKLARKVDEEEAGSNEKEIALSIAEFEQEARVVAESDPRAMDLMSKNSAFNAMTETAQSFKAKHKLVKEGEISPNCSPDEIARLLDGANQALTNFVDTGACIGKLRKIFAANAPETAHQIVTVGGLCDRLIQNQKEENGLERALIFVRHAAGYDVPQQAHVKKKFLEINREIAKEQLKSGLEILEAFLKGSGTSGPSAVQKATIHFQKALHQEKEITEDVVSYALEYIENVHRNFSAGDAIKLIDIFLSIGLDESEGDVLKGLETKKGELTAVCQKAALLGKEAVALVLQKQLNEARKLYEQATKLDETAAFRSVTAIAQGYRVGGEIKNAYSVYSWIARVDRNETDLQYINVAWCCLLLGDKERARTFIDGALKINKNIIEEAISLDPSFKESEVMKFYIEEKSRNAGTRKPSPAKKQVAAVIIREISQALIVKDTGRAFALTKQLLQKDPQVFQRLARAKPQIQKLPVFTFYRRNFVSTKGKGKSAGMNQESIKIVVTALKLFSCGKKKEAVTSVIAALRSDPEILNKVCVQYSSFRKSALMNFYFSNKDKVAKVLGFEPRP